MVNYQEKAMLSVSSLVHSLCKNNPVCENTLEVRKIINQLEGMIAPSCKVTEDTFKTVCIHVTSLYLQSSYKLLLRHMLVLNVVFLALIVK